MKTRKNKKGFTIVELVIVIGVIGILSAILIPTFVNLTNKANQAREQEEVRNAYVAYSIDAQDGKLFEGTAGEEAVASVLAINQVAVKRDKNFFTYSLDNKQWEDKGTTLSGSLSGYVQYGADTTATYQYNGCLVFHPAA